LVGWLEFNVPFQHKYSYIRDKKVYSLRPETDKIRLEFWCHRLSIRHGISLWEILLSTIWRFQCRPLCDDWRLRW